MRIITIGKTILFLMTCLVSLTRAQNTATELIRIELYDENPKILVHDVVYKNGTIKLAASLLLSSDGYIRASAVIAQGSGNATTRENTWAGLVAQLFVESGIAVLFTDKRGTGESGGDWQKADFNDLASDLVAGLDYLAGHDDLGSGSKYIGLIGLSQGGHYAPLAASMRPGDVAFIVNIGASMTTIEEQLRHELINTFIQDGISGDALSAFAAVNELMFAFIRGEKGMWERYVAEVDALREGPSGVLVDKHFNTSPESWVWDWIPKIFLFDPIPYWRKVRAPMFIAYGGEDEHDNVPVSVSVNLFNAMVEERRDNPDQIVRVYEGASHGIQVRKREADGVIRVVLDPRFKEEIAKWLVERFN